MPDAEPLIPPADPGLVRDPLAWFAAEHARHRQFCAHLLVAAEDSRSDAGRIAGLIAFIRDDLGRHVREEEEELFPLLRKRARREDRIEAALGRLTAEHAQDISAAESVLEHLETCLKGRTTPNADPPARRALEVFAARQSEHLALENAVVLPLARRRLSAADIHQLGDRLARRLGLGGSWAG